MQHLRVGSHPNKNTCHNCRSCPSNRTMRSSGVSAETGFFTFKLITKEQHFLFMCQPDKPSEACSVCVCVCVCHTFSACRWSYWALANTFTNMPGNSGNSAVLAAASGGEPLSWQSLWGATWWQHLNLKRNKIHRFCKHPTASKSDNWRCIMGKVGSRDFGAWLKVRISWCVILDPPFLISLMRYLLVSPLLNKQQKNVVLC